ncbi:MAG: hypothetical protein WKF40_06415 [Thermoleophilaceae bacterium]
MRRGGALGLILVLPDGSRSLIPAAWTDLEAPAGATVAGTLGSLGDLLAARRVLDGLLGRGVLAGRDDGRSLTGRPIVQLCLDLREGPAPAVALWEVLADERRQAALALLSALIAEAALGSGEADDERAPLRVAGAPGGRDD